LSTLKSVGRTVAPIAQQVGTKVVLPVATQALTNYAMSGAGIAKSKGPVNLVGGSFLLGLKSVGKFVAPMAEKVAVPMAQNIAEKH